MKIKKLSLVLAALPVVIGCSVLESRFGNGQQHYKHLEEGKSVALPNTAMQKGYVFDIPKPGARAKDLDVNELPPTY